MTSGAFTRWKYRDSNSYMAYIGKIAEYLNLTTEYLLEPENSAVHEDTMSEAEIRLIKMFRKMDSGKRSCLLMTAEYFIENEEKTGLYLKKNSSSNKAETTKTSGETSETDENPLS